MIRRTAMQRWTSDVRPIVFAASLLALSTSLHAGAAPPDPVLLSAGDIASCATNGDQATAALLDGLPGSVVTLGDNAYESGTAAEFANCYGPTWGRQLTRTHPAAGNHDYVTAGAAGYYGYFGAAAGNSTQGYYSYDLGAWHLVALNSNCVAIGGCGAGSPQETWLRADLAAHPAACTLAYWHHPLFSSGLNGNQSFMQPIFQALYDARADIVLSGHDHDYERFALQTPAGVADPVGIREFVVGTGGRSLNPFNRPISNSEVRNFDAYGVLMLTLHPSGYDWQFLPEAGKTFSDSGSGSCHKARPTLGGIDEQPDSVASGAGTSTASSHDHTEFALGGAALAVTGAVAWYARRKLKANA